MSPLPERYRDMPADEIATRIEAPAENWPRLGLWSITTNRTAWFATRIYGRFSGTVAARRRGAGCSDIVFCGFYFMAETAAILCQPEQRSSSRPSRRSVLWRGGRSG
jgi:hypothetical protein